jgi:hypothetical protein
MKRNEYIASLSNVQPPANLAPILLSLWWDGKGNWQNAHEIAQEIHDIHGSWIHAYLHRKEGDMGNADYWYHRAGRERPSKSIQEEWDELVNHCLGGGQEV